MEPASSPFGQPPLYSAPAPGPAPDSPWSQSPSVLFLLYMLVGFSSTLALILFFLSIYYLTRCLFWGRQRRQSADVESSVNSMVLTPKELYLVVNPGGAPNVAFREDEEQQMVPRKKAPPLKSFVIEVEAGALLGLSGAAHQNSMSPISLSSLQASGSETLQQEDFCQLQQERSRDHYDGDELVQSSSASSGAVALEGQARRDAHGRVGDQCICNPEYSAQALPSSSQHEVASVAGASEQCGGIMMRPLGQPPEGHLVLSSPSGKQSAAACIYYNGLFCPSPDNNSGPHSSND